MPHHLKCALIGVGPMGVEYAKVLKAMESDAVAVGRGAASAAKFREATGLTAVEGGLAKLSREMPSHAIVASSVETLASVTIEAIRKGAKKVLVEKPGALSTDELRLVKIEADKAGAQVYIAYNRRFLASVLELKKRAKEEGGVLSGHFEFTEWSHVIGALPDSPAKRTTFLSNSTHVVDLAFHLLGEPSDWSCYMEGVGELDWNSGASRFVGSGKTIGGALFSYCANWLAPGRWGVEVMTRKSRFILRPLEKLQRQPIGSVQIEELPLDLKEEQGLKPGLFRQVDAFFRGDTTDLVTLDQQMTSFATYERMAGKLQ